MRRALACCLAALATACAALRDEVELPIELDFEGNTALSDDDLERAVEIAFEAFELGPAARSTVDDAAYEVEREYAAIGFAAVSTTWTYDEDATPKPAATITIVEGPRTRVDTVRIEGPQRVRGSLLREAFERAAFDAEGERWFVESRVRDGANAVREELLARGFYAARVGEPAVERTPDGTVANVTITVEEGELHTLARIEILGDPLGAGDARLFEALVGQPYRDYFDLEAAGRIETWYGDRGHVEARAVRVRRDVDAGGRVALAFRLAPGPHVTVGRIDVHGDNRTREVFVRKRIALTPGQPWRASDERETVTKLYRTGLFEKVDVTGVTAETPPDDSAETAEPTPGDAAPPAAEGESVVRDVDVRLVESPSVEVFVEPGYGSYERLRLTLGAREKNLFGRALVLDVRGTVSELAQRGEARLIDPFFLPEVRADVNVFGNRRQEPSFLRIELGAGFGVAHQVSSDFELAAGYEYRRSDSVDVEVGGFPDPDELANDVDISAVTVAGTYDGRDNPFAPRDGAYSKLSFEVASEAIGTELSFLRARFTQSWFHALWKGAVVGTSWKTGWMVPTEQSEVIPLQERFFNGGESTVRSFSEQELGPQDADGDPIGGEAFHVFSIEVRQRVVGRLEGALFFDIGNVELQHQDWASFNEMRQGIGAGIRYELPVGPIRLDGAINPDPDDGESRGAVHLSVGLAF